MKRPTITFEADSFGRVTKGVCERTEMRAGERIWLRIVGTPAPASPNPYFAKYARCYPVMSPGLRVFLLTFALADACIQSLDGWKDVGLEERAKRVPIVFHGLAIEATPEAETPDLYDVQFWMINIYKGADVVADFLNLDPGSGGVFNLRDRRINVTGFGDRSGCHPTVAPQKYYVIFCELRNNALVAMFDDLFGAAAEWSERTEEKVWAGVGWEGWSDWGACSASCGEGVQERIRQCRIGGKMCHGYNKERRRCNMFPCQGAVDPMRLDDKRFFHPSRGEWERVSSRPTAWRLRPNSYIWVPSTQIFPDTASHKPGLFPRQFTLLVTLKLSPMKAAQGTVFSLRSRRQQNAYLSLELESGDRVRVVHATNNSTQAVVIPMKLNDGHWHQLGLALQDDNSVRSFLDCAWVSTDILRRKELDHPEDADLIIGYLFQGELEQLVIVPDPSAVAQQCSSSRIPIYDPAADMMSSSQAPTPQSIHKEEDLYVDQDRTRGETHVPISNTPINRNPSSDDVIIEGSAVGDFNTTDYEVEWSEWSLCSMTCGSGTQTRFSRCVDDGINMELCMEAGGERTETRPCITSCQNQPKENSPQRTSSSSDIYFNNIEKYLVPLELPHNHSVVAKKHQKHHKHHKPHMKRPMPISKAHKRWCGCLNGGKCLKDGTCRCPISFHGRLCEREDCRPSCMNGGVCKRQDICTCPPMYSGPRCEIPNCEPPCHNGGTCIQPNTCSCPPLTSGQFCQKFECSTPCRNGGQCVGPDVCECPHNATGRTCEEPRCEPPCENGGTCALGNSCLCSIATTGVRCEKKTCEYEAMQEPYTRGFRRLVNKKVEIKCQPWSWKTCYKTVPEYQTVYKTFYRTSYKCKQPFKLAND